MSLGKSRKLVSNINGGEKKFGGSRGKRGDTTQERHPP